MNWKNIFWYLLLGLSFHVAKLFWYFILSFIDFAYLNVVAMICFEISDLYLNIECHEEIKNSFKTVVESENRTIKHEWSWYWVNPRTLNRQRKELQALERITMKTWREDKKPQPAQAPLYYLVILCFILFRDEIVIGSPAFSATILNFMSEHRNHCLS